MLICHCKAVNDQTIRAAVMAGASDIDALAGMCGAGSRCGGCIPAVIDLLERVHEAEPMAVGSLLH
jgi:bacterioferritin-associated ferredoxin